MTDQQLAQAVANRLWAVELEAEKVGDKKRIRQLRRAHAWLAKAHTILLPPGDVAPLSGGTDKPPQ